MPLQSDSTGAGIAGVSSKGIKVAGGCLSVIFLHVASGRLPGNIPCESDWSSSQQRSFREIEVPRESDEIYIALYHSLRT